MFFEPLANWPTMASSPAIGTFVVKGSKRTGPHVYKIVPLRS